jgi:hypothetical protein
MRVELRRRVLKLEGRASLPCPCSVERWLTKTDGMSRNLETGEAIPTSELRARPDDGVLRIENVIVNAPDWESVQ